MGLVKTFTVLGGPATKGSTVSFMGSDGHVVTKTDCKSLVAWTQAVGWAAREVQTERAPRDMPVRITAVFQFMRPKSQVRRTHPTVKPDLDKVSRALLDALTGVAYDDDAQVVELSVVKAYGHDARTTVIVEHLR